MNTQDKIELVEKAINSLIIYEKGYICNWFAYHCDQLEEGGIVSAWMNDNFHDLYMYAKGIEKDLYSMCVGLNKNISPFNRREAWFNFDEWIPRVYLLKNYVELLKQQKDGERGFCDC